MKKQVFFEFNRCLIGKITVYYKYLIRCFAFLSLREATPANIYLFKVNNRNTGKRCEICSKLTIKTPERRHWRRSCVFIVNFEHIFTPFSSVFIADFEQVNVDWSICIVRNFQGE